MKPITSCPQKRATAYIVFEREDGPVVLYFRNFAAAVGFCSQEGIDRESCHIHKMGLGAQ